MVKILLFWAFVANLLTLCWCSESCGGDPNAVKGCGFNCNKHCPIATHSICSRFACQPNGCDCKDGFLYDSNVKMCVEPEECSPLCEDLDHEEYDSCINGGCGWRNCSQVGGPILCKKIDPVYCIKGCRCQEGYYKLDKLGKCVPEAECTSCGGDPNAKSGCGNNCNKRCEDVGKKTSFCTLICEENGCDCKDGYYLDSNINKCVRPEHCTPKCKENERYVECPAKECQPQTCGQVGFRLKCVDPDDECPVRPGCICNYNYVRNNKGICRPKSECPSCGGDRNAQAGCGVYCGKRCPNNNLNTKLCPRICLPNSCDCKDGFLYDINDKMCVKPEECSPRCEDINNEEYDSCVNGGCGWRNCSQIDGPIQCIRPIKCKKGCRCKDGYYRLDNNYDNNELGKCVQEDECPFSWLE